MNSKETLGAASVRPVPASPSFQTEASPVKGIFWMFVTGLCFVAVTALVKALGTGVPPAQSAFLRYLLGLVFLLPVWRILVQHRGERRDWLLFAGRGVVHALGVILWFFAMTQIPLAEVTAMNYLSPVYVTLGAALFLGERLAARRIAAVIVAMVGAMIILRPGFREVTPGHFAMLFTALAFGVSYLLAKSLVARNGPVVVVAMLSVWVTIGLAPFAWSVWVPVSWQDIGILFGVACFATAGHFTMTLAFAAAPVTVTQPVTFLQLVWATALGAMVFAEPVDSWVVLGGGLILGAICFIAWREQVVKRQVITPPDAATKL